MTYPLWSILLASFVALVANLYRHMIRASDTHDASVYRACINRRPQ